MMPKYHAIPVADLELLRKFDTPTVCNVIELLDHRPRTHGYMDGRIQACFPKLPPMVGYASTATYRSAAAPRPSGTSPCWRSQPLAAVSGSTPGYGRPCSRAFADDGRAAR